MLIVILLKQRPHDAKPALKPLAVPPILPGDLILD